MDLTVIDGEPLPFTFDILTALFHYGNRVFAKYRPTNILGYFKQTFPDGYFWQRTIGSLKYRRFRGDGDVENE